VDESWGAVWLPPAHPLSSVAQQSPAHQWVSLDNTKFHQDSPAPLAPNYIVPNNHSDSPLHLNISHLETLATPLLNHFVNKRCSGKPPRNDISVEIAVAVGVAPILPLTFTKIEKIISIPILNE
jgi:hypothetical protein